MYQENRLESGLSEYGIAGHRQQLPEWRRDLRAAGIETRVPFAGADIARQMRFSDAVRDASRSLDDHWALRQARRLKGRPDPADRAHHADGQVIDVFHHRKTGRRGRAQRDRGALRRVVDPRLWSRSFVTAQTDPEFWPMITSPDIESCVFAMKPALQSEPVDEDYLDDIVTAFSDVVDAKSPFTADHSNRVTLYTDMIAEEMGLSPAHRRWLRRAGPAA